MTRKYQVKVEREIYVTVDETKFTEEFMEEFRGYIDSTVDTIEDHIEHLGWLYAAGRIDNGDFIEGYGLAKEFGIEFAETNFDYVEVTESK